MSLLNFREYLIEQSQERYPSFIIHAPAISRKTWFAERVKDRFDKVYGVKIMDLQDEFSSKADELWAHGSMSPAELKKYLFSLKYNERILIIDNPDFLINTWSEDQKVQFVSIIENGISAESTKLIFIFIIQTDLVIVQKIIENSKSNPRIIHMRMFAEF